MPMASSVYYEEKTIQFYISLTLQNKHYKQATYVFK
jgi:hypothetical protein